MDTLTRRERRERRRAALRDARAGEGRRSRRRRALLWGAVIVGIVGGVYGVSRLASRPENSLLPQPVDRVTAEDHASGPADAPVTLIEYSDFQCPACAAYEPVVQRVRSDKDLAPKLRFVYRHFPLPQHGQAETAALAAEAAGEQGKFWEMHDKLFAEQTSWAGDSKATAKFQGYAAALGLEAPRFAADLDAANLMARVKANEQSGLKAGVDATPTFFLNGRRLENVQSYDDFRNAIREALAPR